MKWLVLPLLLAGSLPAAVPEFSIDTVMAQLRPAYPQVERVPDGPVPGVRSEENLDYASRPGGGLALDIYRPADARVLPAVLIVHGGGWLAGSRTMERPFARRLAALGYVAVPVSYRLGAQGRFPAPVIDLKEAVRWLRAHAAAHGIDGSRIAIIGGSAGGTLALTVGTTNGRREFEEGGPAGTSDVQAVVDIDGTATFLDNRLVRQSETEPSPYWEYVHGTYSQSPATWVAASPLLYVTKDCPPTFFIKSTCSQPILAGREEMQERLEILGVPTGSLRLPGTPHPFWLVHPWLEQVLAATDGFLKRELKR